jgi:glutamate-1-semialdehyde 2,1-aminomutase
MDPYPIYFRSAHGATLVDIDGNKYLDYHGGFGTAVLGYAHPEVTDAVAKATAEWGVFVGVPHEHEVRLAERLTQTIPGAEMVALCGGGGSDAIYHGVRLARAFTRRTKLVKVEGGYHGWHDALGVSSRPPLAASGYERLPRPYPNSAGSLQAAIDAVIVVTVNDEEAMQEAFDRFGDSIAAVVLEPVLHSAGCVLLDRSYLEATRRLCARYGALLIFDEVMTGFRHDIRGTGALLGVKPDLAAFGKAIANGYIISCLVGRRDVMSLLAPAGPVFYSGTFNGHPLSVAAALATLDILVRDNVPIRLWDLTGRLVRSINAAIDEFALNAVCQSFGSVWCLYFYTKEVRNYRDLAITSGSTTERLNDAFRAWMREHGVYIHRRHVNRCFVGAAHTEDDIDRTGELIREFLLAHRKELQLR